MINIFDYREVFEDLFDPDIRLITNWGRFILNNEVIPKYLGRSKITLDDGNEIPCEIHYMISELYYEYPKFLQNLIGRM